VLLAKILADGSRASWFGRDDFIINPTYAEIEAGDLDLVVAGSPEAIMVEAGANQLPEQDIIEAIDFGYEGTRIDPSSERANSRTRIEPRNATRSRPNVLNFIRDRATDSVKQICLNLNKQKIVGMQLGCGERIDCRAIVTEDPPELPVPKTRKRLHQRADEGADAASDR